MPTNRWHGCYPPLDGPPWRCPKENARGTVPQSWLLGDDRQNNRENDQRKREDDDHADRANDGGDGALDGQSVMISRRYHEQHVLPEKDGHAHQDDELAESQLEASCPLQLEQCTDEF